MKEEVLSIIEDILKCDKKTLIEQINSKNLWDSLLRVEIFFAIEEEFGVQFTEDEFSSIETPAQLCEAVIKKVEK